MLKRHAANFITASRILFAFLLLFFSASSPWFLALYLLCGLTDMMDGAVARRTNSVSAFGAGLDTVADFIFLLPAFIKFLPTIEVPTWLWFWIGGIAVIKLGNLIIAFRRRKLAVPHTVMNKMTGGLLFLLPLTLAYIDLRYSGTMACGFATVAAVQEGYYIRSSRSNMISS